VRRWAAAVPSLIGLALVVMGCSAPPKARPSTSPSAVATTPSKRVLAEAQALAAYVGMWQAMATADEIPDPDASDLRRYATGDALARVVGALVNDQTDGHVSRGRPVLHASVASAIPAADPTEVDVVDCGDSTHWTTHYKATGVEISPDPRGRRHITAVVKKVDGVWKVATFDIGDFGTC
jgi:hypothetical protein